MRASASAQETIVQALQAWEGLRAGAFGLGNPRSKLLDTLEPLVAAQTLARARSDYLDEVIAYNKAQFRLYNAMGQPVLEALPRATALPVQVPAAPPPPVLPPIR